MGGETRTAANVGHGMRREVWPAATPRRKMRRREMCASASRTPTAATRMTTTRMTATAGVTAFRSECRSSHAQGKANGSDQGN
jgi:hypothetical protein